MGSRFKWRDQYDDKRDEAEGARVAVSFEGEESLTAQEFTKDNDPNEIMRKFGVMGSGVLPEPVTDPRFYGDLTEAPDLRTVLDRARDATDKFLSLPAAIRARFHNDPALLHEWVNKPEHWEEAVALGLLQKHVPKAADAPQGASGDSAGLVKPTEAPKPS